MSNRQRTSKKLAAAISQIEDVPTRVDAALLEAGDRPSNPTRRPSAGMLVDEIGMIIEQLADVLGIVLPIRGQPPESATPQPRSNKISKLGVEQPSLPVSRLVPRV